ncbi:transposase [Streptomyces sp. NPDC001663]|uniref:transposase n=1 Tax=Streptomyces sp. NPDC001663 TaxID=3364597 RepID=UPI0036817B09
MQSNRPARRGGGRGLPSASGRRDPSELPGLGIRLAARIRAEIGDDRTRFAYARGLKAYSDFSPVTRASGKKSSITRRWVKDDRLNHAGYLWAISAAGTRPPSATSSTA